MWECRGAPIECPGDMSPARLSCAASTTLHRMFISKQGHPLAVY